MTKESNIKAAKRKKDKTENFVGDEDRLYRKKVKLCDKESRTKDYEIHVSDSSGINGTNFKLDRLNEACERSSDGKALKKKRKSGKDTVQYLHQSALESDSSGRLLQVDENEDILSLRSEQSPKETEKDDQNKKKKKRRNECSGETIKERVDNGKDAFLFNKKHVLNEDNEHIKSNEKIVQQDVVTSNPKSESKRVTKGKKRKRKNRELNIRDEAIQGNDSEGNFQSFCSNGADEKESSKGRKKKKKKKNGEQAPEKERKTIVHPAVDYLLTWYNDRNNWSFKKVRQVWLLHNIFDQEQVSTFCSDSFPYFIC